MRISVQRASIDLESVDSMVFKRETIEYAKKSVLELLLGFEERYKEGKGVKFGELRELMFGKKYSSIQNNLLSKALYQLTNEGKVYGIWNTDVNDILYIPKERAPLKYKLYFRLKKFCRTIEPFYRKKREEYEVKFEWIYPKDFFSAFLAMDTFERNEFDIINHRPWELVEAKKETKDGFASITFGALNARVPEYQSEFDKIWMIVEFRRKPGEEFRIPPYKILRYGDSVLANFLPVWHERTQMCVNFAEIIVWEIGDNPEKIQAILGTLGEYWKIRDPLASLKLSQEKKLLPAAVKEFYEFLRDQVPPASLFRKTKYAQKNRKKADKILSFLEKKIEEELEDRKKLEAFLYPT